MKYIIIMILSFILMTNLVFAISSPTLTPSSISVNDILKRNQDAKLPDLRVQNPTDQKMKIQVSVIEVQQIELNVPDTWVIFSPSTFTLQSNEVKIVKVRLKIPKDAKNGLYRTYLGVKPVIEEGSQTLLIPSVAAILTFEVGGQISSMEKVKDKISTLFASVVGFSNSGTGKNIIIIVLVIGVFGLTINSIISHRKRSKR